MRRYELDLCRIFACLMVVMIHLSGSGWHIDPASARWAFYNLVHSASRVGIPLFFMLSGTLFLSREQLDRTRLLRVNLPRLVWLYFFWAVLYELIRQLADGAHDSLYSFFTGICYGHYHLWFLPAMALLYLFLPPLHGALRGRSVPVSWLLGVFGVLVVLKSTLLLIPEPPEALAQLLAKLNLDHLKYLVYMLLGYWLSEKDWTRRTTAVTPVLFLAAVTLAAVGNYWYANLIGEPSGLFNDYFAPPILFASCCVFCFFLSLRGKVPQKAHRVLRELSDCTLGVYLLHPFALESLGRAGINLANYHPFQGLPLLFCLIVIPCFAVTFLLRRIPLLRKLV